MDNKDLGARPGKPVSLGILRFAEARKGVITSVAEDNYTEINVRWDDGVITYNLWCAKKGHFDLVYL